MTAMSSKACNPPRHPLRTMMRSTIMGALIVTGIVSTGCTTNYLTNSTQGTYGVPLIERTIAQRLLDRSIEHTAKVNAYSLQENLQNNSRLSINSFYSEVLLTGEVPNQTIKTQIEQMIASMPDVTLVYNELNVSPARDYRSTLQDGFITSKLLAKAVTNAGVKSSQIKIVTNNSVVYVMGRTTPAQESHLIDIATSTIGLTEVVLLASIVNEMGVPINNSDVMSERNIARTMPVAAQPAINNTTSTNTISTTNALVPYYDEPARPRSSSPYIELYRNK